MTAGTLSFVEGIDVLDRAHGVTADADLVIGNLEKHHGQALLGFVRRQGLTDAEAQDAVQDGLFRLWLQLRAGTVIDNPRAWVYRAVFRIAMDHHRLRARISALTNRLATGEVEPPADTTDRLAVWAEVNRLLPAAAAGPVPAVPRRPLVRGYRADPRDHAERGTKSCDPGLGCAPAPPRSGRWSVMDDGPIDAHSGSDRRTSPPTHHGAIGGRAPTATSPRGCPMRARLRPPHESNAVLRRPGSSRSARSRIMSATRAGQGGARSR